MIAGRFVSGTSSASAIVCFIVAVLSPDVPQLSSISNLHRDFTEQKQVVLHIRALPVLLTLRRGA